MDISRKKKADACHKRFADPFDQRLSQDIRAIYAKAQPPTPFPHDLEKLLKRAAATPQLVPSSIGKSRRRLPLSFSAFSPVAWRMVRTAFLTPGALYLKLFVAVIVPESSYQSAETERMWWQLVGHSLELLHVNSSVAIAHAAF